VKEAAALYLTQSVRGYSLRVVQYHLVVSFIKAIDLAGVRPALKAEEEMLAVSAEIY